MNKYLLTDSEIREYVGDCQIYCEQYYKLLEAQDLKSRRLMWAELQECSTIREFERYVMKLKEEANG